MTKPTISLTKIKHLSLKNKIVLTDHEALIIQKEFQFNTIPNLQRFQAALQKYAITASITPIYFENKAYLRPDQVTVTRDRATFLRNIENKTPEGYVYVLNKK